jgi:hypothetical protein
MSMSIIDWPASLVPRHIDIRPPSKTVGLNTSLSEFSQAVPAIRPPFGITMEFDWLHGSDILAYRALRAALEGRANLVRVPIFDMWHWANDTALGAGEAAHSDGSGFSDGALYLVDDLDGVAVSGVQGDRTITADFGDYGELLEAGLYFGLGDHCYIATQVSWEGTVATIRFSPSLRTDYTEELLRLKPVMICRLSDDNGGQMRLQNMRHGAPTLDLTEAFDGLFS